MLEEIIKFLKEKGWQLNEQAGQTIYMKSVPKRVKIYDRIVYTTTDAIAQLELITYDDADDQVHVKCMYNDINYLTIVFCLQDFKNFYENVFSPTAIYRIEQQAYEHYDEIDNEDL